MESADLVRVGVRDRVRVRGRWSQRTTAGVAPRWVARTPPG